MRTENDNGVSVQLVQSKSRVAPIDKVTIPRLELIGCTIGARLGSIGNEHTVFLLERLYNSTVVDKR